MDLAVLPAGADAGRSTCLAATLDGVVAGVGVVRWTGCHGSAARLAHPHAVETTDLQVVAAMRGRGVGTVLVRAAEDHALRRGVTETALSVDLADGARARRLYRRLGYEPTGVIDTVGYLGVDDDGVRRRYTETSELLLARLTPGRAVPLADGARRSSGPRRAAG